MATIKGPDFTKKNKTALVMTFPDGDGGSFELEVYPPTKGIWDAVSSLAPVIDGLYSGEIEADEFDMDDALEVVAKAMSLNSSCKKFGKGDLERIGFDIEDIGTFIGAYIVFVAELVKAKN